MTSSATRSVNYQWYSRDSLIILIPGQWLAGWLFTLAWSWGCHCWLMGKTKGALDGARGRVRSWSIYWTLGQAAACRCPPHPQHTHKHIYTHIAVIIWVSPEEEGPAGRVGFMIIEKDKKRGREREWGIACVFPRHASSCETMIYAFLRTLGSQNVTFNQAHWEQSKC